MKKKYLIFIPTLLQLGLFWTFDLGVDEAHYMLYARHLALSYFDHPPLVGWVHFLVNFILGENLAAARLPAIAIGAFSAWQVFQFLRRQDFSEAESIIGSLAGSFAFQIFVLNTFLLPDTLCVLLVWPLLAATKNVASKNRTKDWLWLGLWLGLSGLAKYTSVLMLIPVGVVIISKLRFSFLKKFGFYAGVGLACAVVLPVFIWNQQHQWGSFQYQSHHVLSTQEVSWQSFFQSWILQFVIYSPFLWPWSIWGFVQLSKKMKQDKSSELQFAWWTAVSIFVFFLYASFQNTVLPHWPVLFYLFTLPFGVALALRSYRRWILGGLAITSGLIFILALLLITGIGYRIPQALKDVGGWPQTMSIAQEKLKPGDYLAVTNWTYGSRAFYYGKAKEAQIFVLGNHNDQFDLWRQGNPEGSDILILQIVGDEKNLNTMVQCQVLEPAEQKEITVRGSHVYDVSFQWCRKAHLL